MSPLADDLAVLNPTRKLLQRWSTALRRELKEGYWDLAGIQDLKEKLNVYIKDILPKEIAIVEVREYLEEGKIKRLPPNSCDVLILLVGFSIEPLLQSICVWKPKKVMLLVNQAYGMDSDGNVRRGEDFALIVQELIEQLANTSAKINFDGQEINNRASSIGIKVLPPFILKSDESKDVFRKALEIVKDQNKDYEIPLNKIVIDITGGKKTMVTGAYLFAAFANINMSYVDFDDDAYDPDKGKPYGDAFRIGILENPYTVFKLHEWKAVEQLYEKQLYGRAKQKVDELLFHMGDVFETTDISAATKLRNLLEIYELWDRGDYQKASRKISHLPKDIGFTPPIAISPLSGQLPRWPDISMPNMIAKTQAENILAQVDCLSKGVITFPARNIGDSIYLQKRFLDYINDEMGRTYRLINNGEYRSAFIKSYSVIEVLLVSQVLAKLKNNLLEVTISTNPSVVPITSVSVTLNDAQINELSEKIVEQSSAIWMLEMLSNKNRELRLNFKSTLFQIVGRGIDKRDTVKIKLNTTAQAITTFWQNLPISDVDTLRKLRNQTIHFCLWIPKDVAEAAYKWADACFNNLISNINHMGLTWTYTRPNEPPFTMDWKSLCELCGIDFLLNK